MAAPAKNGSAMARWQLQKSRGERGKGRRKERESERRGEETEKGKKRKERKKKVFRFFKIRIYTPFEFSKQDFVLMYFLPKFRY